VECYWTLAGNGRADEVGRVLPDGCMDLLFVLAGGSTLPRGAEGSDALVVGTQREALVVYQRGDVELLGVRFRPGALPGFVPLCAAELVDAGVPLSAVAPAGWAALRDRLADTHPGARMPMLDDLLGERLRRRPPDALVRRAAALLEHLHGPRGARALADELGVSRRTLERRFRAAIGVGPGTLARILRFRAAARELLARPARSISRIAAAQGYADHPHLTREFRSLAGLAPRAYRAGRAHVVSDGGGEA
jgi:AraC-like DNA-binding protein